MPICGWRARISCAARSPSSVCVGRHADVDDGDVGHVGVDLVEQLVRGADLRRDLDPGAGQDRGDPLADEDAVVRDHDPHGSSAMTVVPAPGRADHGQPPVERLDAVGQPAQPRAAGLVGAADAVVGDLDDGVAARAARRARWPCVACAYLATLVSASEATK